LGFFYSFKLLEKLSVVFFMILKLIFIQWFISLFSFCQKLFFLL